MGGQLLFKIRHLPLSTGQAGLQGLYLLIQGSHSARQSSFLLLQISMICLQAYAELRCLPLMTCVAGAGNVAADLLTKRLSLFPRRVGVIRTVL